MPQVTEKYLEDRKNKIAKAAVNVFSKKGYSNATMKDIMDEAKVSRGGLYAHFENIDSVFIAALKYDDSSLHNRFLTPNPDEPLLSQIKNWVQKIGVSTQNRETCLVRAKSEFFLSHDVSKVPYLRERHEKLAQDIQLVIKMGIKTGEFKNQIDVNSFAELLIALIDGVMLHHCYQYSSSFNLLEILGLIEKMIENSLS
ncbi:TetR/AcrR family transcriptional regulator [Clostridium sporogenes]|uniref:TetR/AcrR family transcriptional regulator n=1 Tax=Clostridium TaxID=1485 RepID=UPI003DA427F9